MITDKTVKNNFSILGTAIRGQHAWRFNKNVVKENMHFTKIRSIKGASTYLQIQRNRSVCFSESFDCI